MAGVPRPFLAQSSSALVSCRSIGAAPNTLSIAGLGVSIFPNGGSGKSPSALVCEAASAACFAADGRDAVWA